MRLICVLAFFQVSLVSVHSWAQYTDPHCSGKQVLVHLFMWKWTDIATECENFLSKHGFCGVQISPPNEHAVLFQDGGRPWWDVYQPVSYRPTSRMGTEEELTDMVGRCNAVGVRIYVDAVINHMAAVGRTGNGTAGTPFNGDAFDYPGVPYSRSNFNDRSSCPSENGGMDDVMDANNVRNCELLGLRDLNQRQDYVRDKIADYLNSLIDIGVAGFRVDASKHIWPRDLKAILSRLKDVQMGGRPFFIHEVTDFGNEAVSANEYKEIGYVTEFRYGERLSEATRSHFSSFSNIVNADDMLTSSHALTFVDNHDTQRNDDILTYKSGMEYKMAVAYMLAYDYGYTRVMSSYEFSQRDEGPPQDGNFTTLDVECGSGWVCEHRWNEVTGMVAFRNAVSGSPVMNWVNSDSMVAFSRGNKGFFAMSNKMKMSDWFDTGLPAGRYCDVISDCGSVLHVDGNGRAHVRIDTPERPMVAYHVGWREAGEYTCVKQENVHQPLPSIPTTYSRTVVLMERVTSPGQIVTLMGGVDHNRKSGCTFNQMTSACAIPIKHRQIGSGSTFSVHKALASGDNFLDWYGREEGQGSSGAPVAIGSPMAWTTNEKGHEGYYDLNTFGPNYWAFDVDMDCSVTLNGWFEVKARIDDQWEADIGSPWCGGRGRSNLPFVSQNHVARCGYINVFRWNSQTCDIYAWS